VFPLLFIAAIVAFGARPLIVGREFVRMLALHGFSFWYVIAVRKVQKLCCKRCALSHESAASSDEKLPGLVDIFDDLLTQQLQRPENSDK
jgi:hypothetical protein